MAALDMVQRLAPRREYVEGPAFWGSRPEGLEHPAPLASDAPRVSSVPQLLPRSLSRRDRSRRNSRTRGCLCTLSRYHPGLQRGYKRVHLAAKKVRPSPPQVVMALYQQRPEPIARLRRLLHRACPLLGTSPGFGLEHLHQRGAYLGCLSDLVRGHRRLAPDGLRVLDEQRAEGNTVGSGIIGSAALADGVDNALRNQARSRQAHGRRHEHGAKRFRQRVFGHIVRSSVTPLATVGIESDVPNATAISSGINHGLRQSVIPACHEPRYAALSFCASSPPIAGQTRAKMCDRNVREIGYTTQMQLPVELSASQLESLRERASSLGITVEQLASASIADLVARPTDDFEQAASRILSKNGELYRRLAQ